MYSPSIVRLKSDSLFLQLLETYRQLFIIFKGSISLFKQYIHTLKNDRYSGSRYIFMETNEVLTKTVFINSLLHTKVKRTA